VRRSPDKGEQLCKELKDINPEGEAFFIEKSASSKTSTKSAITSKAGNPKFTASSSQPAT